MEKALIVKTKPSMDIADIVKIAEAEGSKLFKKPNKIKVVDILRSHYGVIVVVQNLEGCSQKNKKPK